MNGRARFTGRRYNWFDPGYQEAAVLSEVVKTGLSILLLLASASLAWAGDAYWIDVRTAEEYADGHVRQAVNIPYEEITARIGEVTDDKDALIYLYCRSGRRSGIAREALDRSGRRSGIAREALERAGFSNAINLGGLEDAQRAAARQASAADEAAEG
jgi:phage shock protein E